MYAFAPILLIPLLSSEIAAAVIAVCLLAVSSAICYGFYFKYDFPANHVGFYAEYVVWLA